MKIQLRRNNTANSSIPTSGSATPAPVAGEPLWFKDRLYIGSVGSANGGESGTSAGDPIKATRMVYFGSSAPSNNDGQDGDIYLEITQQ